MNFKNIRVIAITCLSLVLLWSCASKQATLRNEAERGDLEKVRKLVAEGTGVNEKDSNNVTPLMYASGAGHIDVVTFLLENGASVNSKNDIGNTALSYATEKFHINVAKILLQKGADINAQSESGQTVLMRALYQDNKEVVQFLLQNGADVNLADNKGFSALTVSVVKDDLDNVKALIKQGAREETESKEGQTLLMTAAYHGSSKVFSFLMEKGPDINKLTQKGWSALAYAAMGAGDISKDFDPSIMQRLINAGSSASIKDINGKSIIELAELEAKYLERKRINQNNKDQAPRKLDQNFSGLATALVDLTITYPASNAKIANRIKEIKEVLDSRP